MKTGSHRRCVSCNKVSSQEIETDIGDFSSEYFVTDPNDKDQFICKACSEWHEELMADYEAKDDPYGWEEDGTNDLFELLIDEILHEANDNEPPSENSR